LLRLIEKDSQPDILTHLVALHTGNRIATKRAKTYPPCQQTNNKISIIFYIEKRDIKN
jgi:hypothetical protein